MLTQLQTRSHPTLIDITFCGIKGRVCADTGSSHSIAGERMFQIFMDKGLLFQETTIAMSLADGQQTTRGEATDILEHHINTGNSPPIYVPPYRMSPVKKEILRKEIEDLLEKDIIEECESPYGAFCTDSKAKQPVQNRLRTSPQLT
ncbi:uncharacterized protein TNCV_216471 [Trichonephila clavipes]|nr:uncharacterized protein TNCV_216471 [Trichonephila clavipes]